MQFDLYRSTLKAETQLEDNRWQTASGFGMRIVSVAESLRPAEPGEQRFIIASILKASPVFAIMGLTNNRQVLSSRMRPHFVTFNREAGHTVSAQNNDRFPGLTIASVKIAKMKLKFEEPMVIRDEKWVARYPDWGKDLRLGFVGYDWEARFTRTVSMERVEISD